MAGQSCILVNCYPCDVTAAGQDKPWPVTQPFADPPATNSFPPIAGSLAAGHPSKRRLTLDRCSARITDSSLTGADVAVEYLRHKYSKNHVANTIRDAGFTVLSLLQFLNETGTTIFKITRGDISGFIGHVQDRGLKISSVRCRLRGVYAFINFLVEHETLSPAILHKKIRLQKPEVLPRAIPAEDITLLLSAITTVRDRAVILLLLRSGMRIGELLQVKVDDIIVPERKILLYLGEKNYLGRVVYFSEDAENALLEWLHARDEQHEYLFYSPTRETLGYVAAWKVMKKILERAGLSGKGYSLHSLRHTFATDMLNAGLRLEVLQQLLGHKTIEITMRYAKISDMTRKDEYYKAMTVIEQGRDHEPHRINSQLQAVFEEKKLLTSHSEKLSA